MSGGGVLGITLYMSLIVKEYVVELRRKGGASHAQSCGKRFLDKGKSQSKHSETGACWWHSGYSPEGSVAGARWSRETVNEVRKVAAAGRGGAKVRSDLLGPPRPLSGHWHCEMGRHRGLEQKSGVTWCVLKVSFRKDVGGLRLDCGYVLKLGKMGFFFS